MRPPFAFRYTLVAVFAIIATRAGAQQATQQAAAVGDYELAPTFHIVITREGNALFGQPTGQDKVQLFPEREDAFSSKW